MCTFEIKKDVTLVITYHNQMMLQVSLHFGLLGCLAWEEDLRRYWFATVLSNYEE